MSFIEQIQSARQGRRLSERAQNSVRNADVYLASLLAPRVAVSAALVTQKNQNSSTAT